MEKFVYIQNFLFPNVSNSLPGKVSLSKVLARLVTAYPKVIYRYRFLVQACPTASHAILIGASLCTTSME